MNYPVHPDFDAAQFRQVLGQFATGVTIITTRNDAGRLIGITASSFNSVSLDPPLILWSLASTSSSMDVFRRNSHYVVNILSAEQLETCKRFATFKGDRFEGVAHELGNRGLPILGGTLAWLECHNRSRYDEGDHVIFVGEVERCGFAQPTTSGAPHAPTGAAPLVFFGGSFHTLAPVVK